MLTQQQHDIRLTGIGASDAAAVLAKDPWCTPLEKYLEKLGITEKQEAKFGTPMYWGNLLEPIVAQAYSDFFDISIVKSEDTIRHSDHEFMLCHLDYEDRALSKIIECKTANPFSKIKWGDSGTTEAPLNYLIQVQHQMAVKGWSKADIAVLIGGCEFRYYAIDRDEQIISAIIEGEQYFWENHILPQVPPSPINKEDILKLFHQDNGTAIDATDEIAESVHEFNDLKQHIKAVNEKQGELEDKIALFMGQNASLEYYGKEILTWKSDKNGKRSMRVKV